MRHVFHPVPILHASHLFQAGYALHACHIFTLVTCFMVVMYFMLVRFHTKLSGANCEKEFWRTDIDQQNLLKKGSSKLDFFVLFL